MLWYVLNVFSSKILLDAKPQILDSLMDVQGKAPTSGRSHHGERQGEQRIKKKIIFWECLLPGSQNPIK